MAGDVPGGDIIEVVQLVRANLLAPYAPADVLLVEKDGADGGVCPAPWVSMGIPLGVMRRGRRDVLYREDVGDLLETLSGSEHLEDPAHDGGGNGVGLETVEPLAQSTLLGIGMLAGVCEPVAVGRATAKMAAAHLGQHRHAVTHTDPDQVAFLLRRTPEHPEQHLGGGRAEVDSAADLREPQLDPEVLEQRVGGRVLDRRAEGPGELTDHDGVPGIGTGAQLSEESARLGSTGPGQGAGVADVEVVSHDLRAGRKDRACLGDLAGTGRLGLLHLFGRDPTHEREQQLARHT